MVMKSYLLTMKKCFLTFPFALLSIIGYSQDNVSIDVLGEVREFIVYAPVSSDQTSPVVFCFHGYTNNADFQMNYTGFNEIAASEEFIVVYPQGAPDDLGINHWNADLDPADIDDIAFVEAMIDYLALNYSIDPSRLYSCGFSNGGMMSYTLACEMADVFAAVASVAGSMPVEAIENCAPSRFVPVMHVHGTLDLIVPIDGGGLSDQTGIGALSSVDETVSFWSDQQGGCASTSTFEMPNTDLFDFTTVTKTIYSGCEDGGTVWKYVVNGGGHTWPGAFPLVVVGNTNQDVNASAEIWDFFSQFTLPTAVSEGSRHVIDLYPNPAQSEIRVSLDASLVGEELNILSVSGEIVFQARIEAPRFTLNAERLAPGIYLLLVTSQRGLIQSEKFVVCN